MGTLWAALEATGYATAGQHDRVIGGALDPAIVPTTVMGWHRMFATFVGEFHEILGFGAIQKYFWVLVYSSLFDPTFWSNGGYAYQNFYADYVLNNGSPEGIFEYIDMLTWKGWLWGFAFWALWHTYVYLSSGVLAALTFLVWYLFNSDIPLCAPSDFADNWFNVNFGWNLCAYPFM